MHLLTKLQSNAAQLTTQWHDPLGRQLILLTVLRLVRMFMIAVPVIAVYWDRFGLSLQDIMVLQVIFAVTLLVLEMPSGWLADRFGNKPVIIWGCVLGPVGYAIFLLAPSYTGFIIGEMILAVSTSLISGARDALLHNTLAAYGKDDDYKHVQGRLTTWGLNSEAVAAAFASVLIYSYGNLTDLPGAEPVLRVVILAECLVLALAIPVALLLKPYDGDRDNTDSLWKTVHYCFYGNRRLLWLNIFTGAASSSTLIMFWYSQLYWDSLDIPLVWFGVILSGLLFISGRGSRLAGWLDDVMRFRTLFGFIAFAPLVLYGLLAVLSTTLWSFAIIWLFWLQRGVSIPLVSAYVQRECTPRNRATVLSANMLMARLFFAPVAPFLGTVVDVWSFTTAFALSAIVFGSLTLFGYLNWLRTVRELAHQ